MIIWSSNRVKPKYDLTKTVLEIPRTADDEPTCVMPTLSRPMWGQGQLFSTNLFCVQGKANLEMPNIWEFAALVSLFTSLCFVLIVLPVNKCWFKGCVIINWKTISFTPQRQLVWQNIVCKICVKGCVKAWWCVIINKVNGSYGKCSWANLKSIFLFRWFSIDNCYLEAIGQVVQWLTLPFFSQKCVPIERY